MGSAFHEHEEMTFEHFVLFVKSHKSQIEGNVNVYLKLEPSLSDLDRKMIGTMLESFIQFLTHPNIEEVHLDYDQHLDTWMQSHLSIMTTVRFNFFRIIFEKSLITLMVQMKYNRTASVMIFLLSIFSRLVQSYHQWGDDESRSSYVDFEINAEVRRLKLLYKLDERLIRSSGTKDLAEDSKRV
ncbi:hypothetical protein [Fictibacillus gelatini]|uniref:hypothetical protein n=1 Tax=Fictibacillus gelatini TaxID=225985 RepID=UPI0003F705C8|nr:hypothetical protein [Fictibacillus gelatini]